METELPLFGCLRQRTTANVASVLYSTPCPVPYWYLGQYPGAGDISDIVLPHFSITGRFIADRLSPAAHMDRSRPAPEGGSDVRSASDDVAGSSEHGVTPKRIDRCLKRFLARRIWRLLTQSSGPLAST